MESTLNKMGFQSICPFCCKGDSIPGKFNEDEIRKKVLLSQNFSTFVRRHLGVTSNDSFGNSLLVSPSFSKLHFCSDCSLVIESICKQYYNIKCMELQLEWKIQSLRNIMEHANKIKSRRHLLKVVTENFDIGNGNVGVASANNENGKEIYKCVKRFRKNFIKSCLHYSKASYPQVMLGKRIDEGNVNVASRNENSPISKDNHNISTISGLHLISERDFILQFIKWNLSLSILLMLNCITSPHSINTKSNTKYSNPLSISPTTDETQLPLDEVCKMGLETPIKQPHESTIPEEDVEDAFFPNHCDDDNASFMSFDAQQDVETVEQNETENSEVNSQRTILTSLPHVQSNIDEEVPKLGVSVNVDMEIETTTENSENSVQPEGTKASEISTKIESNIDDKSTDCTHRRYNLRATRISKVITEDAFDANSSDEEYSKDIDENSSSDSSDEDYDSEDAFTTSKQTSQCQYCGGTFKSGISLTRHITSCLKLRDEVTCNKNTEDASKNTTSLNSSISRQPKKRKFEKCVKSEYTCTEGSCNEVFKNEDEYIYHKKLHGSFTCNFCEKVETFAPDLAIHEETHAVRETKKRKRFYYCPRCPYESASIKFFVPHHLSKHLDIRKKHLLKWQCSICKTWLVESFKEIHFTSHHDTSEIDSSKILKCEVDNCQAYFIQNYQISAHMQDIHLTESTDPAENETGIQDSESSKLSSSPQSSYFKCKFCNKLFKMRAWLTQHIRHAHIRRNRNAPNGTRVREKLFKCPVPNCKETCWSKKGLEIHSKLHGTFNCKFCTVVKDYAPDLALHEIEHAIGNLNEICGNDNQMEEPSKINSNKSRIYKCPRCKYFSSAKHCYIRHHVEKHMNLSVRTETCEICGVALSGKARLDHFLTHHNTDGINPNDIYKCDQCPAYFVLGIQLLTHKNKVHIKEVKCDHCDTTFTSIKARNNHNNTKHRDIDLSHLPEACEVPNCKRRFATKPELEWHTTYGHIYHERNSGALSCKICGRSCLNENGLRVHMKQHDPNRKPKTFHVCDQCGKEFRYKDQLETHSMFHAGPSSWAFKCSVCAKSCINQFKLDEHMRTHTKEKPFVCENCGEKYAHRHNLRLHVKNKHGYELPLLPRWGGSGAGRRKPKKPKSS